MKSFSLLWKETFEIIKTRSQVLFVLSLLSLAVGLILQFFLNPESNATNVIKINWSNFLPFFVLSFVVNIVIQISSYLTALDLNSGLIDTLVKAIKNFGSYIWIALLMFLAIMGGFILLIIPGIIFSLWYSFSLVVFLAENVRGYQALKRSKELVRGNIGQIFKRFFFILIFFWIASSVIGYSTAILFENNQMAYMVSNLILSSLFMPVFAVFTVVIYRNIAELKGSHGLELPPQPPMFSEPTDLPPTPPMN
jgi:hypothetical protein